MVRVILKNQLSDI